MMALLRNIILPVLSLRAKKYQLIMAEMEGSGMDLEDSVLTLDYFLSKSDMVLDKEILEKVSKDDFVEIYDKFGVQLFRSFNIYKYTSFTWDEIFSKRMDQLYDRPEFYNKMLFKTAYGVMQRKTKFATNFCPQHTVFEKKENGTAVDISYKFMAPVYDSHLGNIIGVVVCEQIKPPSSSQPIFQ